MKIYNRTEYKELTPSAYSKEKKRIQVELLKLQEYIIKKEIINPLKDKLLEKITDDLKEQIKLPF